mmetsp:Transcript_21869/g.37780  ORF Transcript_21869/g.37780 Transcript_21869/m.37780 type:complete len:224 (+) Transcript_21869:502-1173(+)
MLCCAGLSLLVRFALLRKELIGRVFSRACSAPTVVSVLYLLRSALAIRSGTGGQVISGCLRGAHVFTPSARHCVVLVSVLLAKVRGLRPLKPAQQSPLLFWRAGRHHCWRGCRRSNGRRHRRWVLTSCPPFLLQRQEIQVTLCFAKLHAGAAVRHGSLGGMDKFLQSFSAIQNSDFLSNRLWQHARDGTEHEREKARCIDHNQSGHLIGIIHVNNFTRFEDKF